MDLQVPRGRAKDDDPRVDGLFQLPLAQFTPARNALVGELKRSGDTTLAARVKGLSKPSLSTWTVNQLYWRHTTLFDQLLRAGERLRAAHLAKLAGGRVDLRASISGRDAAISDLAKAAASLLRESGHSASPDTMRRVVVSLEALAFHGRLSEPKPGRLTRDLDPPGLSSLSALAHAVTRKGPKVIPFASPRVAEAKAPRRSHSPAASAREHALRAAEARKRLKAAERDLAAASQNALKARAAMKRAAARAKAAERRKAVLEAQLEKATAVVEAVRQDARRVAARAEEAAQAMDDAERAVARARAAVQRHSSRRP